MYPRYYLSQFLRNVMITFVKLENLDERGSDEKNIKGILGNFFWSHDVKKRNSIA